MLSDSAARKVSIASGLFLLAVFAFFAGWAVRQFRIWPYQLLESSLQAARSFKDFGEIIPDGRRVRAPAYASREKFTVHEPGRLNGGYYVFVGFDSELATYAAWLYDASGKVLHRWPVDYLTLDPDGSDDPDVNPHGFEVLRDGSVIVNFDKGEVMARLDVCGEPLWTKAGIYHHLMARADDGSYWVWRGKDTPYGHFHYLENFDAGTGKLLGELALVEDLITRLGPSSNVFSVRPDFPFGAPAMVDGKKLEPDIFHPNDVDVLTADLAPQFPMFEPGDLLLSFKSTNLVVVIDPDEPIVKWWARGPWSHQHDPDFTTDGWISVYDNNTDRDRSEIVRIDPATGLTTHDLFNGEAEFYSPHMGVHQYLPNGNVLIAVPGEGRIIEVTSDGSYVLEFNNLAPGSPGYNEHVEHAVWVPADYFEELPSCPRAESRR